MIQFRHLAGSPRITGFIIISVYILGAVLFGIYYTVHEKKKTMENVDRNLILGARALKYLLAEDFHDRAIDPDAVPLRERLANQERITAYVRDTDFTYAYTLVLKAGAFYFSGPTVTAEDKKIKSDWYFHPYSDAPPEFYEAIRAGTPRFATYTDQWGSFRSVACPLKSPGGRVYLACADYDISRIKQMMWRDFGHAILTITPMLLLTIPVIFFFRSLDKKHHQALQEANQALTARTEELRRSNEDLADEIQDRVKAEKEKNQLTKQLLQAQKMETIGTLAGGIAHDFNNILFPILGHTEILMAETPEEDDDTMDSLLQIHTSARRARELIRQILTFSRQETTEFLPMKIQFILKEALKLLQSTLPKEIDIRTEINQNCRPVNGDATQVHQVIMNLTTNAYHAMVESGGELRVGLTEETVSKDAEMAPGPYVCLSVADTGPGMPPDLIEKIFDPFFTTKEKGKGTGMGLSVVHGIIQGMGGAIRVSSTLGRGTVFRAFFPVIHSPAPRTPNMNHKTELSTGTERILLVDDEEAILKMVKKALEKLGYSVSAMVSPVDALNAFKTGPDQFDLVLTDMSMPRMSGDDLVRHLRGIRPDIPVILCTGFSEKLTSDHLDELGIACMLMKPLIIRELAEKIREVMDRSPVL